MLFMDFRLNMIEMDFCFNFFLSSIDVCFLDCLLLILWGMDFNVNFLWNLLDLNKGFKEEKLKIKYVILFVKNIFFLILNSFFFW